MLQEPTSTIPSFAQFTESELTLPFDRKQPYNQPIKYQISDAVDDFKSDTKAAYDRFSESHGQPAQTRLRFYKPVNTDTISENVRERGDQGPKYKRLVSSERTVTGPAERLGTLLCFPHDIQVGPERHEAPEIEEVMSWITSMG